jgi:hypothetical protein
MVNIPTHDRRKTKVRLHELLDEARGAGIEHNFTADDIRSLERIRDLGQLKAAAKELITRPGGRRPMKPQKVMWFSQAVDGKTSTAAVIKLMWDLLLGGEGHQVIGTRHSMDPSSYRRTFGEDDVG